MRYHILLLISLLTVCISTSCKDEDGPYNPDFSIDAPPGAITQELGAYWHGRTLLGETNIYINVNNEFTQAGDKGLDEYFIVNVGQRQSFETEAFPEGFNGDKTVTPGNFYQIFPSDIAYWHARDIKTGTKFLNMQVNSYLYDKNERIGAKVTYVESTVKDKYLDTCYRDGFIVYSHPTDYNKTILYLDGLNYVDILDGFKLASVYWKSPNELHINTYINAEGEITLSIHHGEYYDIRKLRILREGQKP